MPIFKKVVLKSSSLTFNLQKLKTKSKLNKKKQTLKIRLGIKREQKNNR